MQGGGGRGNTRPAYLNMPAFFGTGTSCCIGVVRVFSSPEWWKLRRSQRSGRKNSMLLDEIRGGTQRLGLPLSRVCQGPWAKKKKANTTLRAAAALASLPAADGVTEGQGARGCEQPGWPRGSSRLPGSIVRRVVFRWTDAPRIVYRSLRSIFKPRLLHNEFNSNTRFWTDFDEIFPPPRLVGRTFFLEWSARMHRGIWYPSSPQQDGLCVLSAASNVSLDISETFRPLPDAFFSCAATGLRFLETDRRSKKGDGECGWPWRTFGGSPGRAGPFFCFRGSASRRPPRRPRSGT